MFPRRRYAYSVYKLLGSSERLTSQKIDNFQAGRLLPPTDLLLHPCTRPQAPLTRRSSASSSALGKRKSTSDILASVAVGKKAK